MPKRIRPTAKQKKLIEQIPAIVSGKKTKKKALLDAGYSENTADKQAEEVLGSAGVRGEMMKALKKAGVTIEKVAEKIDEGLEATKSHEEGGEEPDYATRHKYVVTALELHDAFPAKKIEDVTPPRTYADLEGKTRAKTLEEAALLAERSENSEE